MGKRLNSALSVAVICLIAASALLLVIGSPRAFSASPPPQVKLSGHPQGAALDYSNHYLYVANNNGYVLVVDPASGTTVKNITTRGSLAYIVYDNSTNRLFASNSSSVVIIDGATNSLAGEIRTGRFAPFGMAAGMGQVFVLGNAQGTGMVKVLNTQTLKFVANITLPSSFPGLAAYDSKDNRLYVADYLTGSGYGNQTSVVDLSTDAITGTIAVPNGPYAVAYGFGRVYVTEAASNQVAVIDPSTDMVVATLTVGSAPDGIAFAGDPAIGVSCYGSSGLGTTNFIDPITDEIIGAIDTPNGPQLVIFDWYLWEFFVVQYDGFMQGFPLSLIQSTTTTAPPPATSTTSSPSASATSSASTATTSATASTTSPSTSVGQVTSSFLSEGNAVLIGVVLVLAAIAIFWWWGRHFRMKKRKKPCPPSETLAQQNICDKTYAKDWKQLLDLQLRAKKDVRLADSNNQVVAGLKSEDDSVSKDAADYNQQCNDWNNSLAGGGNTKSAPSLMVYKNLVALHDSVQGDIDDYNQRAWDANSNADDEQKEQDAFNNDRTKFIAQVNQDNIMVKGLKCIACTKVEELVRHANELPTTWEIDKAGLLNLVLCVPAPPPPPQQPPPPPPGGGGGGGGGGHTPTQGQKGHPKGKEHQKDDQRAHKSEG